MVEKHQDAGGDEEGVGEFDDWEAAHVGEVDEVAEDAERDDGEWEAVEEEEDEDGDCEVD